MFSSSKSLYANTEAFLGKLKWIIEENEDSYEDSSDAAILPEESSPIPSSTSMLITSATEKDSRNNAEKDEVSPYSSPSVSPSTSISTCTLESHEKDISAQEVRDNLDLLSFEVVSKDGISSSEEIQESSCKTVQNNAFGDTALNVYEIASKTTSSVKSYFTSFLEESADGSIVPVSSSIEFHKEAIVIGDIVSIAVGGLRAGASYLLGFDSNGHKDDTVHYRGYKVRSKGMELYLDAVHAKNNDDISNRQVQFQFKLSKSHCFWQKKYEKKIIYLPLKVYWCDHLDTTSMFIKVFDCEIEVEIPIGVPKDSIVVSCDPDKGILTIVAPSLPC